MGLRGPDWRTWIGLCRWKKLRGREGFMHTGLSMSALANKVSRTKSMRFQGWSPTCPWPHLKFARALLDVHDQASNLLAMHVCIWGSHCIKQLSLWFACHVCMQSCIANKQKKKTKKERKSSMNSMHLWFHGWQGSERAVIVFSIFYFAMMIPCHQMWQWTADCVVGPRGEILRMCLEYYTTRPNDGPTWRYINKSMFQLDPIYIRIGLRIISRHVLL